MKTFLPTSYLFLLSINSAHAYFACTSSNATPVSQLLPATQPGSVPSSGGSGGITIPPSTSGSCNSFWIAAGGDCAKHKRQSRYSTLPCLDSMVCTLGSNGALGCVDMASGDVVNDDGTCGNINTGEVREGCVEALMAEAGMGMASASASAGGGGSATATGGGVKATSAVDDSATPTEGGTNGVVSVESQNGGVVVRTWSMIGILGFVVAAWAT